MANLVRSELRIKLSDKRLTKGPKRLGKVSEKREFLTKTARWIYRPVTVMGKDFRKAKSNVTIPKILSTSPVLLHSTTTFMTSLSI